MAIFMPCAGKAAASCRLFKAGSRLIEYPSGK
nr:MAG TPA: hypothetical protein [Caudoviricetes sp.]